VTAELATVQRMHQFSNQGDKYHLFSTDLIGGKVELHVICRRQNSWLE